MDRRVKYTKQIIRETFLELMNIKEITKITVTEICEKADINRATFYKYYLDVFDLSEQIENELYRELEQYLNKNDKEKTLKKVILGVMETLEKNKDICKVILGEHSNKEFLLKILYLARENCFSVWQKDFEDLYEEDFDYLFTYSANGSIALIQLWIKNGFQESALEITNLIIRLTNRGMNDFKK